MLVINPHGGQDDYCRPLPRGGPHGALRARRRLAAVRCHAGSATTPSPKAYAFVLEHLMYERRLAGDGTSAGATRTSSSSSSASTSCTSSRRYCAKLLYELELHRSDNARSKSKRYADLLTAYLGVRYNPADYLFDVDDGFYCARYLRAWAFEAQLRRHLEDGLRAGSGSSAPEAGAPPQAAVVDGAAACRSRSWRGRSAIEVWTSRRSSRS